VKGKLKIVVAVPILLVVLAAAYMFLLKPKKANAAKPKVQGTLVQLPTDFVINLAGGHYGKLSIALLMTTAPVPAADGSVDLPQGPEIRALITDDLTGVDASDLVDRTARHALLHKLLDDIKAHSDEPVTDVLITDLAVQ
jgi:flagellar basal body-associated protein FliL